MTEDDRRDERSPGLLKRVLKFVTNPNMDWQETAIAGSDNTPPYTQDELKALLERKRRNDIVRKREFSALRHLRRHEPLSDSQRMQMSTTTFDDTVSTPEQSRRVTLNKINQIEDQMSRQWAGTPPPAESPPADQDWTNQPTIQQATSNSHDVADRKDAVSTALPPDASSTFRDTDYVVADALAPEPAALLNNSALADLSDPALEEAAVLFASGNDAQAEEQLVQLITPPAPQSEQPEVWRTLMDFYRATGKQEAFDALAAHFTAKFAESAPPWLMFDPASVEREAQFSRASTYWASPATLTPEAVTELRQRFDTAGTGPWIMDWNAIRSIAIGAPALLFNALQSWDRPGIILHISGLRTLMTQVAALTPAGDKNADPAAWELRLELLRLFDTPEEFDLEALEYCMAREVSPPAWRAPACTCVNLEAPDNEPASEPNSTLLASTNSTNFYTARSPTQFAPPLRLRGVLGGNMTPVLKELGDRVPPGSPFIRVNCERLVRIDFAAAGDLLNWVNERDAHGCQVHFMQVQRLVAIFFSVMGIPAHARVGVRRD